MRRKKRSSFAKAGILCLALVLGLGALGVGYAHWTETLAIEGTVGTGEWETGTCETAYAYGGGYARCFSDCGFSDWGWTNGSLSAGSYEFEIHAGVGKKKYCPSPPEETLVGMLTVDYDGSTAIVTYNMDAGFTMTATHLYVGNDYLPKLKNGKYTTGPGGYGNTHEPPDDETTDTYTITGLSGDIYVVAHAVVCGLFD